MDYGRAGKYPCVHYIKNEQVFVGSLLCGEHSEHVFVKLNPGRKDPYGLYGTFVYSNLIVFLWTVGRKYRYKTVTLMMTR